MAPNKNKLRLRKGERRVFTLSVDGEIFKALKTFATYNDMFQADALTLAFAKGLDALTMDSLKPVAKAFLPAPWEWLSQNGDYIETVGERWNEALRGLKSRTQPARTRHSPPVNRR